MKKLILLVVCFTLTQVALQAQIFKGGIKVGISTPDIKPSDAKEFNTDSLKIKVSDANYGYHLGGWIRLTGGKFFIQPEVLFNSSNVKYQASAIKGSTLVQTVFKETYQNLDVPILLGVKLGGFRLNGGPVAHVHINSSSELTDFKSYEAKFKSSTWGYQAGFGADFGKIGIDIRYEGNFSKYGEHLTFNGKQYNFDKTPSRFLVAMSIGF